MSDKNRHIDDLIKGGFSDESNDFNLDSWSSLSNRLDENKSSLDGLISSSFIHDNIELPESVWSNINSELDIDTVWSRINAQLKKRKIVFFWMRSAAAICLLISIIFADQASIPFFNSSGMKENVEETNRSKHGVLISQQIDQVHDEIANDEQSIFNVKDLDYTSNEFFESTAKDIDIKISDDSEISKNELTYDLKNSSNQKSVLSNQIKLEPAAITKINSTYVIDYSNLHPIEKPTEKMIKYELGIGFGVQNLLILDSETNAAFQPSSNNKVKNSFKPIFSVQSRLYMTDRVFVSCNISPKYTVSAVLQEYEKLSYVKKVTELELSRLSFGGGVKLPLNKFKGNLDVLISGQIYGSYMWNGVTYKNETIVDNTLDIEKLDYGIGATVSLKKNFNSFYFEPKIATNFGLRNHLKSIEIGNDFSTKRLVSSELSFALGYRF